MARVTRDIIKTYFHTGSKPTQEDFGNFVDSVLHIDDNLAEIAIDFADAEDAVTGITDQRVMTPLTTKQAIYGLVRLASIPALKTEVNDCIQQIVGTAPSTLDTLQEIATALRNDPNIVGTLTTLINRKADASHRHDDRYYTESEVDNFFDGTSVGKKLVNWDRISNKPITTLDSSAVYSSNPVYYNFSGVNFNLSSFSATRNGRDVQITLRFSLPSSTTFVGGYYFRVRMVPSNSLNEVFSFTSSAASTFGSNILINSQTSLGGDTGFNRVYRSGNYLYLYLDSPSLSYRLSGTFHAVINYTHTSDTYL